ncbi:ketoacyl-ACP synthase III [Paenibacillus sp. FSL M7-1046]|uniref:ketoacyl-ACP synthase III n=1 Tax=Paenibacillus sp. FSL M7-1046 TaxID=2975315 RepID=UPI0030F6F66B
MNVSYIKAIEYYLPEIIVSNDERTMKKIGISERRIAEVDEFASDLAVMAAKKLFDSGVVERQEIDFLIYCTQSPDYILPSTSCIIQARLGLPISCGAFDFNLGCSGYVYGLSIAKGLIESGSARNVLLLTSDTYSKHVNPKDRSVEVLFGDAATATLISHHEEDEIRLGPFVFGTDGKGAENLIIPAGGLKEPISNLNKEETEDTFGNIRSRCDLYMNGPEIFNFTLKEIPEAIQRLHAKSDTSMEDYDYFVFHQANQFMLEHLRKKLHINNEKFSIQLKDIGNTVSSSIPIALKRDSHKLQQNDLIMLVGFGVGYSWAACSFKWSIIK